MVLCGRNEDKLKGALAAMEGTGHSYTVADITNLEQSAALVAGLDKINGVVHSAGIMKLSPLKFITNDFLEEFLEINLKSPIRITRDLVKKKKLANGGSIVFITSISGGVVGSVANSVYSATKAGITGFSKAIALDLGGARIRSNCIAPGMIKTEVVEAFAELVSAESIAEDKLKYPLGDYGMPEDVANGCIFLLSDASKYITGTTLVIDGGLTAQ